METKGSCHEYPEIWRKGLKFGLGNRFRVTSLTGVDHDGMKKEGAVVIAVIEDTAAKKTITFQSDGKRYYRSFSDEWMRTRTEKFPPGEPKQGTDK